ncbi:TonB-dependent receptor [Mucilaginibacter sp. RS28]|uniref:TonB-dependent receptor n=1 Tax=Mucilaginibacter straminoryzae TaxID=2932774 RepID=A0A9X2BAJ5_9SPHI|nr:TonB-dependent receptor [Mucilaginibacter straminoryzae]MCJ8211904.1 TonB-dependent receptor [Mucilaginibacter straminoryzae]
MIKRFTFLALLLVVNLFASAQTKDTTADKQTHTLGTVEVRGYLDRRPMLNVPASVSVITQQQIKLQPELSLVSTLNTVAGVRMEERTPGSYRLSIRGSLLRSPFGVRDVKVYVDEFPLTDAGGNTYLNTIDFNAVKGLEILKGPDGSLFGANSGGVVVINAVPPIKDSTGYSFGLNGGSYGLLHQQAAVQQKFNNNLLSINQAFQSYDGYRDHSYMRRTYLQVADQWQYRPNSQLKFFSFYSDLNYQTPGGLTLAQYRNNPQASRPATATLPSAIQQNIGISTKILYGGISNSSQLNNRLKHVISVFGNHVDFANPFITNYEQRKENSLGLRTYLEWNAAKENPLNWKVNVGLEWQKTYSDINNYDNLAGVKGNPQTLDEVNTDQHVFFARYTATILKNLYAEAALSLNYYSYRFQNNYPIRQINFTNRDFSPELMPRVALSYQITQNFIWRTSVSRGYSTPTTAEVRPTDNVINTDLNAQTGTNYETGFRLRDAYDRFLFDASVFYYRVNDAIVRQLHPDETEYYVNAGTTRQPGFEFYGTYWVLPQNSTTFIRGLQLNEAFTYSPFKFGSYNVGGNNYSNNRLTGVPRTTSISSVQFLFPERISTFLQYNYTAKLPLNDANSAFASGYHLLQAKLMWTCLSGKKYRVEIYVGGDNLLNRHYSLGNDLNAVGNRYYNPAPLRNYYAGFNVRF